MRFEDLNWFDVESYLEGDDRVILITGACEQHGYLSLTTDIQIPVALADAASRQTGVLVAPPLPYGVSPYFTAYPGTVSLQLKVFLAVVENLVSELHRQGFRRMLLLNGHGGNAPGEVALHEMANDLPELRLAWHSWWTSDGVQALAEQHGLEPGHASWLESFEFTRVADLPEGEKETVEEGSEVLPSGTLREILGDGVTTGPYRVPREIEGRLFNAALQDVVAALEQLDR